LLTGQQKVETKRKKSSKNTESLNLALLTRREQLSSHAGGDEANQERRERLSSFDAMKTNRLTLHEILVYNPENPKLKPIQDHDLSIIMESQD